MFTARWKSPFSRRLPVTNARRKDLSGGCRGVNYVGGYGLLPKTVRSDRLKPGATVIAFAFCGKTGRTPPNWDDRH